MLDLAAVTKSDSAGLALLLDSRQVNFTNRIGPVVIQTRSCLAVDITENQFHSDLAFCGLVLALAVSNGYIGNVCMIYSPQMVKLPAEREAVSIFMNSMNVIGVATGSTVSYFLTKLV